MEITGILKVKFDTQEVSQSFKKREFVLTTESNTQYPQHISMQVTQDKCWLLDAINEGDEVKVQFNLRGREWNGPQGIKYFNTIDVWKLERMKWDEKVETKQATADVPSATTTEMSQDDLPF